MEMLVWLGAEINEPIKNHFFPRIIIKINIGTTWTNQVPINVNFDFSLAR